MPNRRKVSLLLAAAVVAAAFVTQAGAQTPALEKFPFRLNWTIYGEHLSKLTEQLRKTPGVDQTVVFGSALHVSGSDHAALEAAVKQVTEGTALRAERIETGLEDVFISLMAHSTDNYGASS